MTCSFLAFLEYLFIKTFLTTGTRLLRQWTPSDHDVFMMRMLYKNDDDQTNAVQNLCRTVKQHIGSADMLQTVWAYVMQSQWPMFWVSDPWPRETISLDIPMSVPPNRVLLREGG